MKSNLTPLVFALVAGPAMAVETPQWPPPAADSARMYELQKEIVRPDSTPQRREAARRELAKMLMRPGAEEPKPMPPRAAIEPAPPVPPPAAPPKVPAPPVAELEVVRPPKPIVIPQTGNTLAPSGRAAVDPRTGHILHETPAGFIDPKTGQLLPR